MATLSGTQLAQQIGQKMQELKALCAAIDEGKASRGPAGRWSPKEVLSHLCGPPGAGHLPIFQSFLDQQTPTVNIDPGNPFLTPERARMPLAELLAEVEKEYERIAGFAAGLSAEQLNRTAHVPQLKESPLGEYPSLEKMISGLGEYHLQFHLDQLREILQALSD